MPPALMAVSVFVVSTPNNWVLTNHVVPMHIAINFRVISPMCHRFGAPFKLQQVERRLEAAKAVYLLIYPAYGKIRYQSTCIWRTRRRYAREQTRSLFVLSSSVRRKYTRNKWSLTAVSSPVQCSNLVSLSKLCLVDSFSCLSP